MFFGIILFFSKVGINTTFPSGDLDVNGSSLRVISLAGETITRIDSGDYRVVFFFTMSVAIV
ncbi:hypothetical protein ACFFVF_03485 [Flavobacterium jumunjinense]|uniref:AhpC/TSA family protein n=1 Tax=Flavobacterium jumunjinense TaxID=998845 RepID=A0ABV5GJM3_9FLAO|nr:hypothetical protein [Flavobacterium jumunjinense]